jgi:hypothetical protein
MSRLTDLIETAVRRIMADDLAADQYAMITDYAAPPVDRARVRPLLAVVSPLGVPSLAPEIGPLPVEWPRSAGASLTWPLVPGDIVRLAPLGADHGNWLLTGTANLPASSPLRWDLALSVVVPFAPSRAGGPLAAAAYSALGPVLAGAHVFLCSAAAADFVALASKVEQADSAAVAWAIANHTHAVTGVTVGTGSATCAAGAAVGTFTPSSTGSTKIHGE